jgi:hypothetical protein
MAILEIDFIATKRKLLQISKYKSKERDHILIIIANYLSLKLRNALPLALVSPFAIFINGELLSLLI